MKRSISNKLLIGLILSTVILAVLICFVATRFLRSKTIDKYEYIGDSVTQTLADSVDGDRIEGYLSTGVPDEYYDQVLALIDSIDERFDTLYVYVAIPTDDCVLYLWANGFPGDETINFTTEYAPGGREWMQGRFYGTESDILKFANDPEFGRVATAATPIYNSKGEPVALAMTDFSVSDINGSIREIIKNVAGFVAILICLYILVFYIFIKKTMVQPITKLTTAARDLTENLDNEHAYQSDIHTGDELEDLSKAFEKMDVELREYINANIKITAEKERLGAELDMASSIQAGQLPDPEKFHDEKNRFDIWASMTPAKEVGGDFYDFFMVDDDHIAMVMADVSGKGVPAALFMMISKLLIKNRMQSGDTPAEALINVNAELMKNNEEHQFVTVWLAILDLRTGKGIATNAGHEHPVIKRAGGKYELVVYKHSPPVATMKKTKFRDHEFELQPGDSLFVYTDGVAEATNAKDELYGTDRMLDALNMETDVGSSAILANVAYGIDAFVDGAEQFDDITMMNFRYFGSGENEDGE